MASHQVDVLIVGAGSVGLALANDLAARGVSFQIIDALGEPTPNSRAHGLQSRTLEALDMLDLARPILAAAQDPQPPFVILSGDRTIARIEYARFLHAPYPFLVIVWQQRIERVLQRELDRRGHHVVRSTRLLKFDTDEDGVTAHVERDNGNRDIIRARWIVGCDGGHSTVRQALGLKMQGSTMPGCFWIGEFDIDWERSRDAMYEWWHRDGMAGAVYIDFTQKWHASVEFHADREEPNLASMQAVFRERTGDQTARFGNPAWMHKLGINQRMPDRFVVGRAILAGDAAHVHTAAGGQGMNTGIQDALNLGWKLALTVSGKAAPTLLRTYETERLPNARNLLRATQTYHHIEIPRGIIARWIGGAILRAMQSIRWFGDAVLARVGMLDVNYQRSTLSRQESRRAPRHARAGWRVPDAPCRIAGRATRLFDIIRGTRASLLLFAGDTAPSDATMASLRLLGTRVAPLEAHINVLYVFASEAHVREANGFEGEVVTDGAGYLQQAMGLQDPEIIYLRPDGYIGLRTQDLREQALFDYLASIYGKYPSRQRDGRPSLVPGAESTVASKRAKSAA